MTSDIYHDAIFNTVICKSSNVDINSFLDANEKLEKHISSKFGQSLLHYAITHNDLKLTKTLLFRNKSNIYNLNEIKDSLMHIIVRQTFKVEKYIWFLILESFNLKYKNLEDETILHVAADYCEHNSFLEFFLDHPCVTSEILNEVNSLKETFLFKLIRKNNNDMVKKCIDKGANLFLKNNNNETIYDVAVKMKNKKMI